jgi:hypothetical protein
MPIQSTRPKRRSTIAPYTNNASYRSIYRSMNRPLTPNLSVNRRIPQGEQSGTCSGSIFTANLRGGSTSAFGTVSGRGGWLQARHSALAVRDSLLAWLIAVPLIPEEEVTGLFTLLNERKSNVEEDCGGALVFITCEAQRHLIPGRVWTLCRCDNDSRFASQQKEMSERHFACAY